MGLLDSMLKAIPKPGKNKPAVGIEVIDNQSLKLGMDLLGELGRKIGDLEIQMNNELAEIIRKYESQAYQDVVQYRDLLATVKTYCEDFKESILKEFAKEGGKTADLGCGTIEYRQLAGSLHIAGKDEKAACEELINKGFESAVRIDYVLLKDVVKALWSDIKDKVTLLEVKGGGKDSITITPAKKVLK